jgi:hypothetical protein
MLSLPVGPILQLVLMMLCAAVAFGLLISIMLVRGRLHTLGAEGPLHDIAFTEKAYVAAATFCAGGAVAALGLNWSSFAVFILVGAACLVADNFLLPGMRKAVNEQQAMPMTGTRARFELLAASCLFVLFWKTAVPPLVTLSLVYGIG